MNNRELKRVAGIASLIHLSGPVYYVASGLGDDIPCDENRFLVMVTPSGDRVAHSAPGKGWEVDKNKSPKQYPGVPALANSIKIDLRALENK